MDFGKIIERIEAILTTPRTEWPVAAAEAISVNGPYRGYIAAAALPIIPSFIKNSLIGGGAFGITVPTPIGMGDFKRTSLSARRNAAKGMQTPRPAATIRPASTS